MGGFPNPFGAMLLLPPDFSLGTITLWAGSLAGIPSGWSLCDGTNGTPDMRDRIPVCSGPQFAVGNEGGNISHSHDIDDTGHEHVIGAGVGLTAGIDRAAVTTEDTLQSETTFDRVDPPTYLVAYIMRTIE